MNRIAERREEDRRLCDRRMDERRADTEREYTAIGIALLAMIHGGVWLGIGVLLGRWLWGA